jgi:hypothetical protein
VPPTIAQSGSTLRPTETLSESDIIRAAADPVAIAREPRNPRSYLKSPKEPAAGAHHLSASAALGPTLIGMLNLPDELWMDIFGHFIANASPRVDRCSLASVQLVCRRWKVNTSCHDRGTATAYSHLLLMHNEFSILQSRCSTNS